MFNREMGSGIALLVFGLFTGITSLNYEYNALYGPGPGFFPLWISVLIILLSFTTIIVPTYLSAKKGQVSFTHKETILSNPVIVFGFLGLIFLAAFLMETLGFIITLTGVSTMFVKMIKKDHPWHKAVIIGTISTVIIYLGFRYGLLIMLPRGILPI